MEAKRAAPFQNREKTLPNAVESLLRELIFFKFKQSSIYQFIIKAKLKAQTDIQAHLLRLAEADDGHGVQSVAERLRLIHIRKRRHLRLQVPELSHAALQPAEIANRT